VCLWQRKEVQEVLRIAVNSVAGYAVFTKYSCTGNHWRYN
jgi:hypothetical protein